MLGTNKNMFKIIEIAKILTFKYLENHSEMNSRRNPQIKFSFLQGLGDVDFCRIFWGSGWGSISNTSIVDVVSSNNNN